MKTASVLLASALLLGACVPPSLVIPDPTIPHQVAAETTITIIVAAPSGKYERQKVKLPAGWWVASPVVVEAQEPIPSFH